MTPTEETLLWQFETGLWTGGVEAFAAQLASGCIMAFPENGLLTGPAILASLRQAPRWSQLKMSQQSFHATGDQAVLGYHAAASRDGAEGTESYAAWCTSVWTRIDGPWRMLQHQQTPVGEIRAAA